jgi:hypothetical protein
VDQSNQWVAGEKKRLSTSRLLRRRAARELRDRSKVDAQQHPTVWCGRFMHAGSGGVYRANDGSSARISGIGTCGCLWTCPPCALATSEVRRAELLAGMAHWHQAGGRVWLLTLTVSHSIADPLTDIERGLARAMVSFKSGAAWRELSGQMRREGSVRSVEVTYSDRNGWHPHSHELVFARNEPEPRLLDAARAAWALIICKLGWAGASVTDTLRYSFDLRGGDFAGEYVTKYGRDVDAWCVADELTRSHAKTGRGRDEHVTPFGLLWWAEQGDAAAGGLFREYAAAFAGKRALFWSPRLKATLGLKDMTDEDIRIELGRDKPLPEEERIATITPQQWSVVVSRDAEGALCELACALTDIGTDRQDTIDDFVRSLLKETAVNTGAVRYRQWRSGNDCRAGPEDLGSVYERSPGRPENGRIDAAG